MRSHLLDLAFLLGLLLKGLDGAIELVGGAILLWLSPDRLVALTQQAVAGELSEDPQDLIANVLLHGVGHLDTASIGFIGAYLLVHGVVKLAIIFALLVGSLRVYPWAIAALVAFLAFQGYELVLHPSPGVALLVILDAVIVWLAWREWRQRKTLRETYARTREWLSRSPKH